MSVLCGNCKNDHKDSLDVRLCYSGKDVAVIERERRVSVWPASDAQINYVTGLQKERNLPDGYVVKTDEDLREMDRAEVSDLIVMLKSFSRSEASSNAKVEYTMLPGRYALKDDDGVWMFYQIDKPDKGRWAGYTFIKRLIGSPGDYTKVDMRTDDRYRVLKIIEDNQRQALIDYGLQSEECGVCSSPLSDPVSLKRGIGPKCWRKMGGQ